MYPPQSVLGGPVGRLGHYLGIQETEIHFVRNGLAHNQEVFGNKMIIPESTRQLERILVVAQKAPERETLI